jgi:hypothetical protein
MYIKWYLNVPKDGYIPLGSLVIPSDITYAIKKYKSMVSIDTNKLYTDTNKLFVDFNNAIKTVPLSTNYKITSAMLKWISKKQYTKLGSNSAIAELLNIYYLLDGTNNHMSVIPELITKYNLIELFGSPLNTTGTFCSPFIVDKQFGSLGSFFNYQLVNNTTYLANPPFDETLALNMALRLEEQLTLVKAKVIVVLPNWKDFQAVNVLRHLKYFKNEFVLKKPQHKYYNYFSDKYVRGVCETSVITLSSMIHDDHLEQHLVNDWKSY